MVESNSIECNSIESIEHNSVDTSNLNNQKFRLNKISEIEDYFISEIKEIYFFFLLFYKISNKWWRFYCIVCNSYWGAYRDNKCKS